MALDEQPELPREIDILGTSRVAREMRIHVGGQFADHREAILAIEGHGLAHHGRERGRNPPGSC
jgi:hypothetical protein